MHAAIAAAGLALGASGAVFPRQQGCCFSLTASGGQSGTLWQLSDGQNRIGGQGGDDAQYCISSDGTITDGSGRGCILTPPTTQFQCDTGATPDSGFSVSSNGQLQHNGDDTFYACPADENEYNVYTQKVEGQEKCTKITLSTGGECQGNGGGNGSGNGGGNGGNQGSTASQGTTAAPSKSKGSYGGESSAPAETTTYACNPAHSYPNGASCVSTGGSLTLVTPTTEATAPGTSKSKGGYGGETSAPAQTTTYACNPAHSYPNGASCVSTGGSLTLVTPTSEGTAPAASKSKGGWGGYGGGKGSTPAMTTTAYETQTNSYEQPAKSTGTEDYGDKTTKSYEQPAKTTETEGNDQGGKTATATQPSGTNSGSGGNGGNGGNGKACATTLNEGSYETPHLIVPVNKDSPDESYGTSYFGQVNSTTSSIFNFDIPSSYEGKTCSIVFLFPKKEDLETANYDYSGSGSMSCDKLESAATEQTTYNSVPKVSSHLNDLELESGNSYVVSTGSCEAGQKVSYQLSSEGGMALNFFEDWNPSPLGLFMTVC
ncbi:hypothetical protein KC356_g2084 [Hortaea werneckii]|nr:hypothetical protein KC356_g2084 [Hortaea werneckii]